MPASPPCASAQRFVEMLFLNGGFGAGAKRDGTSCLGWPNCLSGTPVEFTESEKPVLIHRKDLLPDSGGASRFRGGLGQGFEMESRATPIGLCGGGDGGAARILRNGEPLHAKQTATLAPGDVILPHTPGSSGFGESRERAAVAADAADGYVTAAAAQRLYGA